MRRGLAILFVALSPDCRIISWMPIVDQFARFANLRRYVPSEMNRSCLLPTGRHGPQTKKNNKTTAKGLEARSNSDMYMHIY